MVFGIKSGQKTFKFRKKIAIFTKSIIFIGGAVDLSQLPFDSMSGSLESFSGCIRNLHVNNILVTLEQKNIQGNIYCYYEKSVLLSGSC